MVLKNILSRQLQLLTMHYLANADNTPENWVTYGKNYAEDRFSSLNSKSIKTMLESLDLAWALNLETTRGIEATPLVVDGIMFISGPWSKVFAVNAHTGKMIWDISIRKCPARSVKGFAAMW